MQLRRRSLLLGGLAAGLPLPAFANAPTGRELALVNLHTGESLKAAYWEAGAYVPDALTAIAKVLRDHRTGQVHPIDPQLLDLLTVLSGRLETKKSFQVISGYRSPQTNAKLHAKSAGVATRSLHMDGKAMDVRVEGVELTRLRDAALGLKLGGVGYYRESNFVHVDTGRVRRW
ncbi:MAG TPA: DUF882 domain-containing protein [Phenylobacterium sp.]